MESAFVSLMPEGHENRPTATPSPTASHSQAFLEREKNVYTAILGSKTIYLLVFFLCLTLFVKDKTQTDTMRKILKQMQYTDSGSPKAAFCEKSITGTASYFNF